MVVPVGQHHGPLRDAGPEVHIRTGTPTYRKNCRCRRLTQCRIRHRWLRAHATIREFQSRCIEEQVKVVASPRNHRYSRRISSRSPFPLLGAACEHGESPCSSVRSSAATGVSTMRSMRPRMTSAASVTVSGALSASARRPILLRSSSGRLVWSCSTGARLPARSAFPFAPSPAPARCDGPSGCGCGAFLDGAHDAASGARSRRASAWRARVSRLAEVARLRISALNAPMGH
jgi:hypothetical protein